MPLPTASRRRLRDKALAASRRLSGGPEWEAHVRREFALLAPCEGWRRSVVDGFHRLWYETGEAGGTWKDTRFLGVPTWKCPLDLWVYQELLHELAPDLIVETGTAHGSSALYLATLCGATARGRGRQRRHRRVAGPAAPSPAHLPDRLLDRPGRGRAGRAARPRRADRAGGAGLRPPPRPRPGRAGRLRPPGHPGSYLVVEDTNVNGHPVYEEFGPGPMEAVEDFLKDRDDFAADPTREKRLFTFNPRGWLRRLR